MTELIIGAVSLTPEEEHILKEMRLYQEELFGEYDSAHRNGELALELMRLLLQRNAIPDVRLKYFEDPAFRSGRIKGSYRSLFERNKTVGDDIYRHPNFLKHLRYFLLGAELPYHVMETFSQQAQACGHVGPSDALQLGSVARNLSREFGLLHDGEATAETAEEFFKLALDCGIYRGHAAVVRNRVRSLK